MLLTITLILIIISIGLSIYIILNKHGHSSSPSPSPSPGPINWLPPDKVMKSWHGVNACMPPESSTKKNVKDYSYGHMCSHLMLGHPIMLQAAKDDGLQKMGYNYATVGHDPPQDVKTNCGECYEVHFENDPFKRKPLVVQVNNSQAGGNTNMDIYMPGGGFGAFNSCYDYSYIDNPPSGQTKSGSFSYTNYPGPPLLTKNDMWYNGGIRGGKLKIDKYKQFYKLKNEDDCDKLFKKPGDKNFNNDITSACKWVFNNNYHYNGGGLGIDGNVKTQQVQCPKNLMKVTGLHRDDKVDSKLPKVGENGGKWKYITITTMEDCCQPTCSRSSNVINAKDKYDAMYTCNKYGKIYMDK